MPDVTDESSEPTTGRSRAVRLPTGPRAQVASWLRTSPAGAAFLGVLVGAGAALGALVFRKMIRVITILATGHGTFGEHGRMANPHFDSLGPWFVVIVPVIGGLIYGPLVSRFAPEARGHGVPEVMLAVAERGGRIPARVAVVKSVASALCIGTGGSVGREGPIVQVGSALGSALGQLVRVPERRLRLLVACGAAAGIAATFNAPIAGVFFAMELILRSFEAELFSVVVLSAVTSSVIGRAALGNHHTLILPHFRVESYGAYPLFLGLGLLAAVVGIAFIRTLYAAEDLADRIWRGPQWLRPGVGGLLLGLMLLAVPQMYGVGYPVMERASNGTYALTFLAVLLIGKIVVTSTTIAIGGSGGVFAPSLFMGAMLGSAYGHIVYSVWPHATGPTGAFALVGMGAVFAATGRAPITAVIIMFELTGDYAIILPMMLAIVVASSISSFLSKDTIYTLKLRRRGIDILRKRSGPSLEGRTVADAARRAPDPVVPTDTLDVLLERLARAGRDALPVVLNGQLLGVVTRTAVQQAISSGEQPEPDAAALLSGADTVRSDAPLETALEALTKVGHGLPVVSPAGDLVGWLTQRDVLRVMVERQRATTAASSRVGPVAAP